jgi:hopanoid biosynthesis associated RND transporter like protein HpnN
VLLKILSGLQNAIVARPRRVLLYSGLALLLAIALGLQVEFRTSRSELAPADDPDQQRWSALLDDHSGSEALIACVHADADLNQDRAELHGLVERLAAAFRESPFLSNVFHRVQVEYIEERALHLAPAESVEQLLSTLRTEQEGLRELAAEPSLAHLNDFLAARIERGLSEGTAAGRAHGVDDIELLTRLIGWQRRFLDDPEGTLNGWIDKSPFQALAGEQATRLSDGYLRTRDGEVLFLILSPASSNDSLQARRNLLSRMRQISDEVMEEAPGYSIAFTGQPAMVVEEMDSVRRDTWLTAIIAIAGVSLLTTFVFRWRSHALLVLLALAAGIVWALGAVKLELGYLNMITSSFISTLIGVGVAYGIHPVSEYELEGAHTVDPGDTVKRAFQRTGPGVVVAAVTTAVAFFSIQLMQFKGFGELGLVASVGVLLCLIAAAITLPAMLVTYGRWRQRVLGAGGPRAATVDRVWIENFAERICHHPRLTVTCAGIITLLMLWAALGLQFSTDILDLLPRNSESLRYQRKMVMESELSPLFNIVVADNLDDLQEMRAAAGREASIERFESLLDFLPRDPDRSATLLASLRTLLAETRLAPSMQPVRPERLLASYSRLHDALEEALEAAFTAGETALAGPLEKARAEAELCAALAAQASPEQAADWDEGQARLLGWLHGAHDWFLRAAAAEAPTLENVPAEIRERFVTGSGALLGFLIPAGSVFEEASLDRYVAASKRVSPEATGFPLVFHKMSRRITSGFYRAVAVGALLVALVLLIDFRNFREALLAMLPLGMGVVWMIGAMRILQIPFNFANLVAVPLIIGIGIDNGVHVIHRIRLEGRSGMSVVLRHTGRAIVIASLTTMIGFGSLALASHRGLASLGLVLLLGVGACLITSTVVLPNLLVVLGQVER